MPVYENTTNNGFQVPTAANIGSDFGTGLITFGSEVDGMWQRGPISDLPSPGSVKPGTRYDVTDASLILHAIGTGATASLWTTGEPPGDIKYTLQTADHAPNGAGGYNWLLLTGTQRMVSAAAYPVLYELMGSPSLSGGNFGLPAAGQRSPMGAGGGGVDMNGHALTTRTLGTVTGEETHVLELSEMTDHSHGVIDAGHTHSLAGNTPWASDGSFSDADSGGSFTAQTAVTNGTWNGQNATESATTGISIAPEGSGDAHNTVHPVIVFNCFVKT